MFDIKKVFKRKEKNTKSKQQVFIKVDQKEELPKISPKNVLAALQNEEINELVPLYAAFIKRDLHLGSELRKRRRQVLSVKLLVESEDKQLKEFIETYLQKIDILKLIFDLTIAVPYGFSVINMVYGDTAIDGKSYFVPLEFHAVHPRYTDYNTKERKLYLKDANGNKIDVMTEHEQFLYHEHPEDTGELVDYGVMSNLLLTCIMKHSVLNSNMQYFEMLGVPPVYINADVQDEEEARNLLNQMLSLRSNSVGVFPKDTLINLLLGQAGRTEFLAFVQYCDQQISHNIMGNTLSGNKDGTGSYNLGTIHDDRRKDVLEYDCLMISRTISKLVDMVVKASYSKPDTPYKVYFDNGDTKDEMRLAQIYATLKGAGYKIPVSHVEDMFNVTGIEYIEQSENDVNAGNNFNEGIDKFSDENTDITPQTSLNGAQVTAMLEVVSKVKLGEIPKESATVILESAFHFPKEQAEKMLDFEITPLTVTTEQNSKKRDKIPEDEIYETALKLFENATNYQEALDALLEAYPNMKFNKALENIEKVIAGSYVAERLK